MKRRWLSFVMAVVFGWTASVQAQAPLPAPLPPPNAAIAPGQPMVSPMPAGMPTPAPIAMAPCYDGCGGCNTGGCGAGHNWFQGGHFACGQWYLGGGLYFIQPVFENNPAFSSTTVSGGTTITTQSELNYDAQAAPLLFLGWTSANGLGIRVRWFSFDGNGDATVTGAAITGILDPSGTALPGAFGAQATSNLKVNVTDFEGTYLFNPGCWNLLVSAGVRYAHMSQDYTLIGLDATGAAIDTSTLTASHNFNGVGPTFAIEGRRTICDSCWAFYGSMRASVLAGDATSTSFNTAASTMVNSSDTSVLTIGEVEVGGMWNRSYGHWGFTAQLGFVGQAWINGGNASEGIVANNLSNGNFGFIGGVARFGINF